MTTLGIYDPPLCCPTGVCGPEPDPRLPRFAADLAWLVDQGVSVVRYNLAQEPARFVAHPEVKRLLDQWGSACLPLVLVADRVAVRGRYPARRELARLAGVVTEDGG